jgi:hypothetical protein
MTRNVSDDASNPNKATIIDNDRFKMVDSEANPNSYKEVLWSLIASSMASYNQTLLNKTLIDSILTTPFISSFVNATHNHSNAAGGGLIAPAVATWTPTWTNLTVGNGVLTTGYITLGKLIIGHLELVFGTTTSISGDVSFTAPVTQGTYGAISAPLGIIRLLSGGAGFQGALLATNTTTFRVTVVTTSATYAQNASLSSTVPGTWTTADAIQVQFMYFSA